MLAESKKHIIFAHAFNEATFISNGSVVQPG